MDNVKQLDPFYFKFKGKVARLLGRESVSNSVVALCELVKNSWDADATDVKIQFKNPQSSEKGIIRIIDNGVGLNLQEFENSWMTVGTDDKEKHPVTKILKRPKIGEKGIGRFATEKLAHSIELISKPLNESSGFRVAIDWDEYEKGVQFDKVPNAVVSFPKNKKETGFEIILNNIREQWHISKITDFLNTLGLLLPPVDNAPKFKLKVYANGSHHRIQKLKHHILTLAPFRFKSKLNADGTINFKFSKGGGKFEKSSGKIKYARCGSAQFDLYFFYRDKRGNYPTNVPIKNIKKALDLFGGLHLYRDCFKVNLAGDWAGLDKLRVNDPSNYPGHNQIIGYIKITKDNNPDIIDTTTREGIIENNSWDDLREFIYKSIDLFVENRKRAEGKIVPKRKRKSPKKSEITESEELLPFANSYPWVFYRPLEKEINACYSANLLNSCLVLSRKMIENLIYNLLGCKFHKDAALRWNTTKNRPQDFSVLIDNLENNKSDFNPEDKNYINKFMKLCKPFRRYANSKAHNIMEYVEDRKEISKMKIPEMVQIMLQLIENNK